jgi:glycosyltransferase involved in cell wall biosynthesis
MKKLRIAQVAPLYESVPPRNYGGTERVVSSLTEELVALGHDVTLFASGDSRTSARLIAGSERSLRADPQALDPTGRHLVMVEEVYRHAADFDILHFHVDYLHFPASRRAGRRQLSTLHGRLDIPDLVPLYREFRDMPLVSISNAQRQPLPWANWRGTVYHGLPVHEFPFQEHPAGYLAFLGRISPEKGVEATIAIATRTGMPLRIAAKVDRADHEYFEQTIRPLLSQPGVEYLGEIGGAVKAELLGGADALLFPIDWPEPFGLVMIEALACGTPVVAMRRGSVPEVMADPRCGEICDSLDEAVAAVERVRELPRRGCREVFEQRFTAARMARDYVRVYRRVLEGGCDGED